MDVHSTELRGPTLPPHDPSDPVESAIITSLAKSWPLRAQVKKREPELDDLYDPALNDYPEQLIPFAGQDWYQALTEQQRHKLRAWAWIAYNKTVIDIEQFVVNPGFALMTQDIFNSGLSDTIVTATTQAMVDEQYHTLMHQSASALTRRRRGWALPERVLPASRIVAAHAERVRNTTSTREEALVRLAYMTVAETSISAYLGLMSEAQEIQPINRSTVAMHRRDEFCHASIAAELLTITWPSLTESEQDFLVSALADGIRDFTGSDYETWRAILKLESIANADTIIEKLIEATKDARVVQDCSAIRKLCAELGVEDRLAIAW